MSSELFHRRFDLRKITKMSLNQLPVLALQKCFKRFYKDWLSHFVESIGSQKWRTVQLFVRQKIIKYSNWKWYHHDLASCQSSCSAALPAVEIKERTKTVKSGPDATVSITCSTAGQPKPEITWSMWVLLFRFTYIDTVFVIRFQCTTDHYNGSICNQICNQICVTDLFASVFSQIMTSVNYFNHKYQHLLGPMDFK